MRLAIAVLIILFLFACQSRPPVQLVYLGQLHNYERWAVDELNKDMAIRHLSRTDHTSTHLVRLKTEEVPHYHDHHDLTVSVLSGKSILHFKDHEVPLSPGDVIFIPRGTYHWAESADPVASVVFAVFSPAFDGEDRRRVE